MGQFKKLLRKYIQKIGVNVVTFSSEIGVSSSTVYNWLNGVTIPDLKTLLQLADRLEALTGEQYEEILTKLVVSIPRRSDA
jgi:transcriptional regulator with XRE-family HTH domain